MRNGNSTCKCNPYVLSHVQSNLWGMETPFDYERTVRTWSVQSNLWGMETLIPVFGPRALVHVQSNLWGMETSSPRRTRFCGYRFNRIYEEWKHSPRPQELSLLARSIESMRNGNNGPRKDDRDSCRVQSNLWGMETAVVGDDGQGWLRFNRIYEEWKPVLRNQERKTTLVQSNLWGMETRFETISLRQCEPFNRIYEEWKLINAPLYIVVALTFNRIYEEWKPVHRLVHSPEERHVQSNLWGMETYQTSKPLYLSLRVQSNLWGMETL